MQKAQGSCEHPCGRICECPGLQQLRSSLVAAVRSLVEPSGCQELCAGTSPGALQCLIARLRTQKKKTTLGFVFFCSVLIFCAVKLQSYLDLSFGAAEAINIPVPPRITISHNNRSLIRLSPLSSRTSFTQGCTRTTKAFRHHHLNNHCLGPRLLKPCRERGSTCCLM